MHATDVGPDFPNDADVLSFVTLTAAVVAALTGTLRPSPITANPIATTARTCMVFPLFDRIGTSRSQDWAPQIVCDCALVLSPLTAISVPLCSGGTHDQRTHSR